MSTVLMKLKGAIVVGGEVVKPPAVIECSPAEAANYARRGKAVAATEFDAQPTAVTPSAEVAKSEGGDNPLSGASDANPVDATVQIGDQSVPVQIVGQDADGTVVVTEASGEAIDNAVAAEPTEVTSEATPATAPQAEESKPLTPTQKRAAAKAATAAAGK